MINEQQTHRYDDIINLPHHKSATHPHMSMYDRAAQFSPFAALTGHEDAIKETARLTAERAELSDEEKALINEKLSVIADTLGSSAVFSFTYFVPDKIKSGGAYISRSSGVKKIDSLKGLIILNDDSVIEINQIYSIESEIFSKYSLI